MSEHPFKVRHRQFEYSPLARGSFQAFICVAPVIYLLGPEIFVAYILVMLFLAIGLRPLLERTGLYRTFNHYLVVFEEKHSKRFMEKRAAEIDRKIRDDKYRNRHRKHKDLPKHW